MPLELAKIKRLNLSKAPKHSYQVIRPFKFLGVLYEKGERLKINNKVVLSSFLRNNYIK